MPQINPIDVSLVIPCFKESSRICAFLPELSAVMQQLGGVKILVVDDGSGGEEQQRLSEIIEPLRKQFSCLVSPLYLPENLGKGGAVYTGWDHSPSTAWLGFVDADGSCSASEVKRIIEYARTTWNESRSPAVFASRIKMLGKKVERLLKRHLLGRVYATLVSELLGIPVYDSQCGLKLIPSSSYHQIKHKLNIQGFAFDVELMVALLDSGCRIEEVPIDWHETPGGKVHLIRDSWRMFWDILNIKNRR